jgi:multiple sugar transport system permease protein
MVWGATESSNIYIADETLKTFAFYLSTFAVGNNPIMAGMSAAASLIMFMPNLIIFIALQSRVMNTMSHSGIK